MVGAAKVVGGAVGQVAIQLALEKSVFNKDVQQTTKKTESAFSKTFTKVKSVTKSAFSKVGSTISNAMSKVKDNISQTFNKISTIIKVAMVAATAFMIKFGKDAVSAASEAQSAWTGLYSIVNGTGKSFSEAQGFLKEYVSDGLIPLTDAVGAYKNLAARGYDTEQIEGIMLRLKDAAAFGRQSSYTYGEAIKSATEGLKNENSVLVDNAGVTKNVAKMWDEYAKSIGTTADKLTLAQKRQAEYEGIMKETTFQVGDAQKYADTYAGKLAKLNTAFYNLKVTVGQVITPIVELFLPAITNMLNGLTKVFNKIKSIMAAFGLEMKEYIGGGASSAIGGATESTGGLTSGLEEAGKTATSTAKKIKKAFAGVDEINVLSTSKDSGSGSGSGGSSGGGLDTGAGSILDGMEETSTEVEQNLEWVKRSAYDWGVAFGESINKGLEKIDWEKIQGTATNITKKVVGFINGAMEGTDWNLVGSTLGEGINTGIYVAATFVEEFEWDTFGKSVADGLDGAISTIDWDTLATTISGGFNGAFETSSTFLENINFSSHGKTLSGAINKGVKDIDFTNVGTTLSNGLNGAIDFAWEMVTNIDAEAMGQKAASLINSISKAIKDTDWSKLGETMSNGFKNGINFLKEWIKEVDWAELAKNLVKGLLNLIAEIDLGELTWSIAELLWELLVGAFELLWGVGWGIGEWLGEKIYEKVFQPIIESDWGKDIIKNLWLGMTDTKSWITGKWEEVKTWFSDIKKEAKVEIKQKWADIKKGWNDLTTNIKEKTAEMKAKIPQKWADIKKGWTELTTNVKEKTAEMKAKVATTWSSIKSKWASITDNIKSKTADMKAKVATTWSDLKSKWNNLMSNFKDKTITIKAQIGEIVGNLKQTVNDKIIKPINKKLPSIFPQIPLLAQGGWLAKNNPTLAVVGDNKREPEIVAPESKIRDQVVKGIQEAGATNNNQHFDFTIKLEYPDGKYLIKEINNTQIKDGKISLLV